MNREPAKVEVLEQLKRILKSEEFQSSPRKQKFLRYIVEKTLNNEQALLKGYAIGVDVFDRDESFDPQSDTIVRVEARNLRAALDLYYLKDGHFDTVRIEVPKGRYVPKFSILESLSSVGPNTEQDLDEEIQIHQPRPASNRNNIRATQMIGLALAAIAIFAVVYFWETPTKHSHSFDEATSIPIGPTLTILPFDYDKPGRDVDEVIDIVTLRNGLHFELVDKMSRFRNIFVVAKNPELSDDTSSEIQKIDTQYLLSGSIQKSGGAIRINSVLTRASTGEVLWTRTFNEVITGPDTFLEIQTDIATAAASELGQSYSSINTKFLAEHSDLDAEHLKHYYCLIGYYDYTKQKTQEQHAEIRTCLEDATSHIPKFSSGWAALARIYADEHFNGFNPRIGDQTPIERALDAANRAVGADPNSTMAHQSLSMAKFLSGDMNGFKNAAETALELNPNCAHALSSIGMNLIRLDNSEEGAAMVKKSMAMNPGHSIWHHGILALHHYAREETDQSLRHATQFYQNGGPLAAALYAAVLVQDGRVDEAKKVYKELVEQYPKFNNQFESVFQRRRLPEGVYEQLVKDLKTAGMVQPVATR